MFNKPQTKIQLAVDIGSAFIKAVAIDKSKATPELTAFSYESSAADKGLSIRRALTKLGIAAATINTSISGPSTIVRIIEMPNMTERELKSAVKFAAEKYIPYKLDEVITDCVKLGASGSGKTEVLLVTAKKSTVNNRVELFTRLGVTPRIIDIDSFAVMNAFLHSRKEGEDVTCALINIGAKITNINIVRGNQTYLARDIEAGGEDITQAIKEQLNIERDKAEALKINPGKDKSAVSAIARSVLGKMLDEIRFSFDFYENHYGKSINKVYLSGGSSNLDGINSYVKDIFSGEIAMLNPFNNINMGNKVNAAELEPLKASFAVAVGLGLREG